MERPDGDKRRELETRLADAMAEVRRLESRLTAETARRQSAQAAHMHSQTFEALGRLTSSVVHNVNDVLTEILDQFDAIARRSGDEAVKRLAAEGATTASRGAALIGRLMAFGRRQNIVVEGASVAELVDALAPHFRYGLGSSIALRLALPAVLPPVAVEPSQLHAALAHLVANAKDAMRAGGTLTISAEVVDRDGPGRPPELGDATAVALRVKDDGEGMSAAVLGRATEPFFTTKPRAEGTGLGLAMAHGLMLQSGGALQIDSVVGAGTTVSLYLPVAVRPPAQARAEPESTLDRLNSRLRSPVLAAWLSRWRRVGAVGRPPRILEVTSGVARRDGMVIVRVDQSKTPMTFRLLAVDKDLTAAAADALAGAELAVGGDERLGSWEGAYRRCVRSGKPTYEFARYGFGEGGEPSFERLLLPCSEEGDVVDTLIAVVSYVDAPARQPEEAQT